MQMNPYLSFKGDCEAAFKFYEEALGATMGAVFRYGGSPMEAEAPAGWANKIASASRGRSTATEPVLRDAQRL